MKVEIFQTPIFSRKKKRIKKKQIKDLDDVIRKVIRNPKIGERKTGDLADIRVYKFRMAKQEYLLAYKWDDEKGILIALGVHENFYRDLKKYKNF